MMKLQVDLNKTNLRLESMIRQKSRARWLTAGYLNTRIFLQTIK